MSPPDSLVPCLALLQNLNCSKDFVDCVSSCVHVDCFACHQPPSASCLLLTNAVFIAALQVVLKGPSMKKRAGSSEHAFSQQQSPRSQSHLGQEPISPPHKAPSVAGALSALPGHTSPVRSTRASTRLQALHSDGMGPAAYPGNTTAPDQEQQQQPGSRPSTKGSNSGYSRSSSRSSSRGSRRNSHGSYPAVNPVGLVGFEAAAAMQPQFVQQPYDNNFSSMSPVPIPSGGGLQQMCQEGRRSADLASMVAGDAPYATTSGVVGTAAAVQASPAVQLSTAQRFRQARANQVVPIPEEYLLPATGVPD